MKFQRGFPRGNFREVSPWKRIGIFDGKSVFAFHNFVIKKKKQLFKKQIFQVPKHEKYAKSKNDPKGV